MHPATGHKNVKRHPQKIGSTPPQIALNNNDEQQKPVHKNKKNSITLKTTSGKNSTEFFPIFICFLRASSETESG